MDLEELPIGDDAKKEFAKLGFKTLYPPQEQAVRKGLFNGENLLLAVPTASGKTLVAQLAAIYKLKKEGGKTVYLVPLKAIAWEKYVDFKLLKGIEGRNGKIKVALATGDYDSKAEELADYDVIVATYEKFDSIIRHRPKWISEVNLVVFDEVHYIDSEDRGPGIEILISFTKSILPKAQIIALSATVSNADEIAKWLGAKCVVSEWRPVDLREGVFYDSKIFFKDRGIVELKYDFEEPLHSLLTYSLKDGGQALFFVETRKKTIYLARKLSSVSYLYLSESDRRRLRELSREIRENSESMIIGEELASLFEKGVAFHHAGLTSFQRRIVEDAFRERVLKVITATPTLAAGVNLPARFVCITSVNRFDPETHTSNMISVMEYKQMAGRAGRPKYDRFGEAVIYSRTEREIDYLMAKYIESTTEPVESKLGLGTYFSTAVLASIASGIAVDVKSIMEVFKNTLYYLQKGKGVSNRVKRVLKILIEDGLIIGKDGLLEATALGRRISELYISPSTGISFVKGLKYKPQAFTEISGLHLICISPDMRPKFSITSSTENPVIEFVSKHEQELYLDIEDINPMETYKTMTALWMWINEYSEDDIYLKLGVEPGDLYACKETAQWLAYSAKEIARLIKDYEAFKRFEELETRIEYGVKPELLELVSLLEGIGRVRARRLFNYGFKKLSDIASASVNELSSIPGIGQRLALSIKKEAGGIIRKEEWEKRKTDESFQKSLIEFND
ncbi:MAG: DEAD/DEAH box helicase [Nitrososphaerota archaeon]|nr:DEAD/DEAH box helicase [Nitrososphaerota archaeon]